MPTTDHTPVTRLVAVLDGLGRTMVDIPVDTPDEALDLVHAVRRFFDATCDHLADEDDGWGHDFEPGTYVPSFDTRAEEAGLR